MDGIIKAVKRIGRCYRLAEIEIKIICYADDVIISEDEGNLKRLLYGFQQVCLLQHVNIGKRNKIRFCDQETEKMQTLNL